MFDHSQTIHVSLAYRCWNAAWSAARNRETYGEQASSEGVGGNWRVEIGVRRAEAGRCDLTPHLQWLKALLDHQALWLDWPEFAERPCTVESVTDFLAPQLFARRLEDGWRWAGVKIYESELVNCAAYPESSALDLSVKCLNLTLRIRGPRSPESGLVLPRPLITHEVMSLLQVPESQMPAADEQELTTWARGLFNRLKKRIDNLVTLRIDRTCQPALEITSGT